MIAIFKEANDAIQFVEKIIKLIKRFISFISCNKFNKSTYYFEHYNKKIIIDKDGNGIMIIEFSIRVLDSDKLDYIERNLDISDGKSFASFPSFKEMKNIDPKYYFQKYGFKIHYDNQIIEKVTDESIIKDGVRKNLKYRIHFNQSKLSNKNIYKVSYIFSIPGMFPIKNGLYDNESAMAHEEYKDFSSTLEVKHNIKELSYSVIFMRGISINKHPKAVIREKLANGDKNDKIINMKTEQNPLYTKYTANVSKPKFDHKILVNWDISDKK